MEHDALGAVLTGILASTRGFALCPTGGETFGMVFVVSAFTAELGPRIDEQTAALFKGMYCLFEEVPYEPWSDEQVERCAAELSSWQERHVPAARPGDFVRWLGDRCEEVLRVQRELASPVNAPSFVGQGSAAVPDTLRDIVSDATLVACLDDRWNDPAGLFCVSDRTFLVNWSTSA